MFKRYLILLSFLGLFISCGGDGTSPGVSSGDTFNDPDPDSDTSSGMIPCENGVAGDYDCRGYDLMAQIDLSAMNASALNDCWGWTDPTTSKEYGLVCSDNATVFIDITDPENPIILGQLRTNTFSSTWRDVKTYGNYAFIVSEADNHGMQVFDLTKLRNANADNGPVNFFADAVYTGFGNAHNIVINENSPYAYAVGSNTFSGGPHFVDISDPMNPTAAGGFASRGYSHDAQVVTYNGPDNDYLGREIYIGSNENEVVIVDITDKFNPTPISRISYSNVGYTHQGWLTEDMRYFLVGDETDEIGSGINTRTIVFDFIDLDNPSIRTTYSGPTRAIDHNGYVKGDEFFLANYSAGVRIIDISGLGSNTLTEVGFFDTFPASNGASFNGAWSVYPYFPSGNVIVSDINNGFFVIRKSQ